MQWNYIFGCSKNHTCLQFISKDRYHLLSVLHQRFGKRFFSNGRWNMVVRLNTNSLCTSHNYQKQENYFYDYDFQISIRLARSVWLFRCHDTCIHHVHIYTLLYIDHIIIWHWMFFTWNFNGKRNQKCSFYCKQKIMFKVRTFAGNESLY